MAEHISVSKRMEEEGKSARRKIWKYTFLVFVVSTLFCVVLRFLLNFRLFGLSGLLFFYGLFIVIASLFVLACMGVVCYIVARERQEDEKERQEYEKVVKEIRQRKKDKTKNMSRQ